MAGSIRMLRQDDFTGGLNLRADQFQLATNESPDMLNVEIDPRGGVFSRGAIRQLGGNYPVTFSGTWNPQRVVPFYGASATYLMLGTGYTSSGNGAAYYSTGGAFTQLFNGVTSPYGPEFASWGAKVYICTGRGSTSYVWDGATLTALDPSGGTGGWQNSYTGAHTGVHGPQAEHVITHAGKLFYANTYEGTTTYKTRVRWSHPNDPHHFAEDDYIDINDGGDEITGLATFGGHLLVFKEYGVYAIFGYDSDTFQVVELSRTAGAFNAHTITTTERGVYFFSYPQGLMFYNGQSISDLFEPLRPMFALGYLNVSATSKVFVNYINRRIWVSMPYSDTGSVSFPSVSFVFDPTISQRGAWLKFSGADGKAPVGGCSYTQLDGTVKHVAVHPTLNYVLEVDMYNQTQDQISNTNTSFVSYYRTRWQDAGSYSQKKMFRRPDIVAKQTTVATSMTMNIYRDYEESALSRSYILPLPNAGGGMIWGSSYWGSGIWGPANKGSELINGRSAGLARSIQVEFRGPLAVAWGINSYTLKYSPRRIKV